MKSIPLENAVILWTPARAVNEPSSRFAVTMGKVKIVGRSFGDWPDNFRMSYGACNLDDWRNPEQRLKRLFIAFVTLSARDGMDPNATHEAFLAIPEYRQSISPDQFGATYVDEEGIERLKRSENQFSRASLEATRGTTEHVNGSAQFTSLQVFKRGGGEREDQPSVNTADIKALEKIIGAPHETWDVYMKDGSEYHTQTQHIVTAYGVPICPTTPPRTSFRVGRRDFKDVSEIWQTKSDWSAGASD
jgi:hypothetical protein